MSKNLVVKAPARVVLFLQIAKVGGQEFCGSKLKQVCVYQSVGLYNDIEVGFAEDWESEIFHTHHARVTYDANARPLLAPVKDLAELIGDVSPVSLRVQQRIPIGVGLGGWSATVVGALTACNKLWNGGVSRDGIAEIAAKYVAKAPVAVYGGAVAYEDGKDVTPAMISGDYHWVLVWHDADDRCAMGNSDYAEHRLLHKQYLGGIPATVQVDCGMYHAIRGGDLAMLREVMHNDLQAVTMSSKGHIKEMLEAGESNEAIAGIVSENGNSIAFLMPDVKHAQKLQRRLQKLGCETVYALGPAPGAHVVECVDNVIPFGRR